MNTFISQQVFPIHMSRQQNTQILRKDDNTSENFASYEDEEFLPKKQDIKRYYNNV